MASTPRGEPASTGFTESRNGLGLLFMLPAAAFLLCFLTYPLGLGVWLGFTDTKIGRPGVFVGLENYRLARRRPRLLALGLQHAASTPSSPRS